MIWSISTYKEFIRCQRKWFLNKKVASRGLKDSFRREVYLLSELDSIESWRGKIVDYTISQFVISKLNKRQHFDFSEALNFAKNVARSRYDFAKAKHYKDENLKKTQHQYSYNAIYDFEYLDGNNDLNVKFSKAWNEAKSALTNFLNNDALINNLKESNYLIAQRNLKFKFHDFTVQAVPDLIAFYPNKPPHIYDWKVHYFGTKTYNEQLLVYALSLKSCNPHKDFPPDLVDYSIQDISLTEYQLLKNIVRNYSVTNDHIEIINDFMAEGLQMMYRKQCHLKYEKLSIEDFEKTPNIDNCINCQFKKICKEN